MEMINPTILLALSLCVFCVALLYSSVGHGGASGYIAVMALFSVAPAHLKPIALTLNILVAAIATSSFARAGHFTWRLFWPFAITSIPASFIGGYLNVPPQLYRPLVGIVLLFAAYHLFRRKEHDTIDIRPPHRPVALLTGCLLGLLSGLTGVGGGIFLSPLLLSLRWGHVREVAAVSALFILVNSVAGLAGHVSSLQGIPIMVPFIAGSAILGGTIGSVLGSRHLSTIVVVRTLSVVLTIAGIKLIFI
jgi:hypothetical protein